jgi:hypothetical protein
MGAPCVLSVCLLLGVSVCAQDARLSRYRITLPEGWRQLTPAEVRILRPKLPADLREMVLPGTLDRFGPVDSWLKDGFDGRCLTVVEKEGEPPLDAEGLATIRSWVEARGTYVSGKLATVGPNHHPVLEVVSRIPPTRALEVYAPTGGRVIIFQFRANEDDFAAALPLFRQALETLVFARKPDGPPKLSDRLQNAAIVGAIVGLVLLVLYKWSRK